jgi:hypothetical protein
LGDAVRALDELPGWIFCVTVLEVPPAKFESPGYVTEIWWTPYERDEVVNVASPFNNPLSVPYVGQPIENGPPARGTDPRDVDPSIKVTDPVA